LFENCDFGLRDCCGDGEGHYFLRAFFGSKIRRLIISVLILVPKNAKKKG
jgi:hypothetical protein